MSDLSTFKVIHQVSDLIDRHATREVNAYLEYGWELLSIMQWSAPEAGSASCPIFVLGHTDVNAKQPVQDVYSKIWA